MATGNFSAGYPIRKKEESRKQQEEIRNIKEEVRREGRAEGEQGRRFHSARKRLAVLRIGEEETLLAIRLLIWP